MPFVDHPRALRVEGAADLADIPAGAGPVRVRAENGAIVVVLDEGEGPVAHEVLRSGPVIAELLAEVSRPGEGPCRAQDVREVAPRLAQLNLEGAVVERLRGLDVLHEDGSSGSLL